MNTPTRFPPSKSIAVRLPLISAAIILVVGAALVTAAYVTMRSTSVRLANDRLSVLAKTIAESYASSSEVFRTQLKGIAMNDSLTGFLASPTSANRAVAEAYLNRRGGGRGGVFAYQMRDRRGTILASGGPGATGLVGSDADSFPRVADGDSMAAGALRMVHDSLVYPLVVTLGDSEPIGYLVQWRQVSTSSRVMADLLGKLLGSDGAMYFANADGSVWTDFTAVVPPPTDLPASINGLVRYTRPAPRGEVFAAAERVAGTPWIWTVEFPAASVLGPSVFFLQRLALLAIVCVALGLLVAWLLSRRLTAPLQQLTAATDAMAAGDRGQRIQLNRSDELGQLGISFDAMAAQVDESHQRLEEKVAERTVELNQALHQLQEAHESLVRREKLAMLGQLASGVGHELRNPLGVMSNAVYYLQLVLDDPREDVKEYLAILQHQVALSGKIVSDLLDLARVTPVQREAVTLRSLIDSQLERLPSLEGIQVEADIPDTLPLAAVDPVHAGQVLLNLMTNAVQAMGESGGRLSLRGRHDVHGKLRLEVIDSGPGVPPEHAEKVFEPLFTTKARGIGLGLAVSRSLAQANGGDISLENLPGQGATFIFTMPIDGAVS